MNLQHLRTVVWLRWRLFVAQVGRMGLVSQVLLAIVAIGAVLLSLSGFVTALTLGCVLMPGADPWAVMIAWDVLCLLFLFLWAIGFMSELQRSEPISLDKLLHLPLSLRGAFLVNYFSSFASLTMFIMLPAMFGLALAMPVAFGPRALVTLPLLAGFILVVTAITYQFRGWLAKLMTNPKHRRSIVIGLTVGFILLFQLPNFFNLYFQSFKADSDTVEERVFAKLHGDLLTRQEAGEDVNEAITRLEQDRDTAQQAKEAKEKAVAKFWVLRMHQWIPFAWLPLGAFRAVQQAAWPGLLGSVGLFAIGGTSLSWAYRSTLKFYRAVDQGRQQKKRPANAVTTQTVTKRNGVQHPFPLVPLQPGMIARTNLCSLLRAPEVKMQLLVPVIIIGFVTFPLAIGEDKMPILFRPLLGLGVAIFASVMSLPLIFNIFGHDRHAFRCYLLLPVRGRDILFGKNLSFLPINVGIGLMAILAVQCFRPLAFFDFVSALLQVIAAFMICCVVGNFISTRFPMPVAATAMRKISPRWQTVLAQMGIVLILPLIMLPVAIPVLIQIACQYFGRWPELPLSLLLELPVCGGIAWVYWLTLNPAGKYLESRGKQILQEVTRAEN